MTYTEILGAIGITQANLETIIIFTVIAIGIGIIAILYWKYILAGLFALIFLYIFAHHDSGVTNVEAKVKEPVMVEAVNKPTIKEEPSEYDKYMEECVSLTSKKEMCNELWKEKQ